MRLKWEKHRSNGTVLNELLASDRSQQKIDLLTADSLAEDEENDNETDRLHDANESDYSLSSSRLSIYKGILYSSLSSFFFSLCSVIVKYLKDIDPGQLAVSRFVGIFVLTLPMVFYYGHNPFGPKELRHYLILRGIAGSTNLFLRFHAMRYLPIGDASVIIFSVPVFVSIFASLFLKEPCGILQTLSVCLAMVGLCLTAKLPILFSNDIVTMIYNNSSTLALNTSDAKSVHSDNLEAMDSGGYFTSERIYGILAAFSSTIFAASVYILIRKAKGAHHSVIMFNFGWVAIIETTALTALFNGFSMPKASIEWTFIVVLGVFSFLGQILLTQSLQLEQAGPVAVVRSATDIALALVWQLWFFGEVPDRWSVTGAFLVILCVMLTSLRKWLLSLPEHSDIRRRLFILTN